MQHPDFQSVSLTPNASLGRTHVIINARAGAALDEDAGSMQSYIEEQLGGAASSLTVETVEPDDIVARLKAAVASGCETLIIAGGDGSICAAANVVIGTEVQLGVIPLGTANLMARDLGIPVTYREAVDALLDASPTPVDVAKVNGRVFLCSSLLGLPSALPRQRQEIRGGNVFQRLRGYLAMAGTIWRHTRSFRVRLDDGSGVRPMKMQMAIISNNPYDDTKLLNLTRPSIATGQLGLYVMKHQSTAAAFWLLVRAFAGSKPHDPDFERSTPTRVVIEAVTRSHFELSNDGEIEKFDSPLTFEIVPAALKMLAPLR
ncbi:MAG: hypothetical protein H7X92_02470 [Chitinophagales bacterium]|nr:hypothetical protein [Hyphomicrobiales bacterium]